MLIFAEFNRTGLKSSISNYTNKRDITIPCKTITNLTNKPVYILKPQKCQYRKVLANSHPIFFIEYLTQNIIFHVKSHITKHEFWGLLILKSQHLMLPNLTWNDTWNDTSFKKSGEFVPCGISTVFTTKFSLDPKHFFFSITRFC